MIRLAAAGFGALLRLRRYGWSPLAGAVLAGSAFALALTKREGIALAIGLAAGAAACRSLRAAALTAGAGGCAFAGWHVALAVHGVANQPRALDPGQWLDNFVRGAAWLRASVPPELLLLLLAWPLLLPALARWPARPVLAALAVWALAVAAAYTTTLEGVAWQLSTSLDRVAATPLPAAIAAALGSLRMPGASAAEGPPPPAS